MLKHTYLGHYWKLRKNFLNYLEDSMSQDSLVGSAVTTTSSNKDISCVSSRSSPSVSSQDTKSSTGSRRSNTHNFYPKNLNYAFMPKPNFEECRNEMRQKYEGGQYDLTEADFQEADHPSTFMKMIKARNYAASAAKDERSQVLPSRVIWDGSLDHFEEFRNKVEGHYGQVGAGYLFDSEF